MKTVICTAGTSIGTGTAALKTAFQNGASWNDSSPDLEREIREKLGRYDLRGEGGRVAASAELNSLHRLGVRDGDRVLLLASDTAEGRVCAEAVARVLRDFFGLPEGSARVFRIHGLQVRDEKLMRERGLPNLIDAVMEVVDDDQTRYGGEIILNPTGGFKATVPFLAVIGMMFGLRSVYISELSQSLINLPPLPVAFNLALYERALPAIELLSTHGAVSEQNFFEAIEGYEPAERDLFNGFIERDGQMVTLSTLGQILYHMDSGTGRTIRMLPEVKAKWDAARPLYRTRMERFLIRCSHPLWRRNNGHRYAGSALQIFGNGSQPRIAGVIRGEDFCVTSYHDVSLEPHDDYYPVVDGKKPSDFDGVPFEEWSPTTDLRSLNAAILEQENTRLEELVSENASLQNALREQGNPFRAEIRQLRATVSAMQQTAKASANTIKQLREHNNRLVGEVAELKSALDPQAPREPQGS